jgi:hypothetical protein
MDWVEIALLVTFGVLLTVEAVALVVGDRPITGAARADARRWVIWPWGLGMLSGHFWSPWRSASFAWLILVAIGLGIVGLDVVSRRTGRVHPPWVPFAALLLGLVSGALLWSGGY